MDSMVPVCPLISTRSAVLELCLGENCAFYVGPVRKCAIYVLGHKGAVDLQNLQKEFLANAVPDPGDGHGH
jgi:hypothetical protein